MNSAAKGSLATIGSRMLSRAKSEAAESPAVEAERPSDLAGVGLVGLGLTTQAALDAAFTKAPRSLRFPLRVRQQVARKLAVASLPCGAIG